MFGVLRHVVPHSTSNCRSRSHGEEQDVNQNLRLHAFHVGNIVRFVSHRQSSPCFVLASTRPLQDPFVHVKKHCSAALLDRSLSSPRAQRDIFLINIVTILTSTWSLQSAIRDFKHVLRAKSNTDFRIDSRRADLMCVRCMLLINKDHLSSVESCAIGVHTPMCVDTYAP